MHEIQENKVKALDPYRNRMTNFELDFIFRTMRNAMEKEWSLNANQASKLSEIHRKYVEHQTNEEFKTETRIEFDGFSAEKEKDGWKICIEINESYHKVGVTLSKHEVQVICSWMRNCRKELFELLRIKAKTEISKDDIAPKRKDKQYF